MSTGARLGILAGIIVVAVLALVIAGGGGDDNNDSASTTTTQSSTTGTTAGTSTSTTTTAPAGPPTYRVTVKNAKPVGGIEAIKVNKGDEVRLVVKSDTADEIHIHGYDLKQDVEAGGSAAFKFKATIDGAFEIELEDHKEQIAELTVEP
jgi:copper(I)-binding protein